MTFRTRTAPKPSRRRTRRDDTRRGVIVTLVFSLVILIALSLLGGMFMSNYIVEHWSPVAAVNGEAISRDQVRSRVEINKIRYQRQIDVFSLLRNQTKISTEEFTSLTSPISSGMADTQAYGDAIGQLEQEAELRQYAAKNNITVTDQQTGRPDQDRRHRPRAAPHQDHRRSAHGRRSFGWPDRGRSDGGTDQGAGAPG